MLSLRKDVYYLSDVGLVYIDNGSVTIVIPTARVRKALVDKDIAKQVVEQYPGLFELSSAGQSRLEEWMLERHISF